MQTEVKDAYWKLFDTEGLQTESGPELVELVDHRITEMAGRYSPTYPAAIKCLLAGREGLTAYLRFPAEHHHRIRHSNFIERTFGETRRRTKVIGGLPGQTTCLTLLAKDDPPRLPAAPERATAPAAGSRRRGVRRRHRGPADGRRVVPAQPGARAVRRAVRPPAPHRPRHHRPTRP
jgi:hypothetical protein